MMIKQRRHKIRIEKPSRTSIKVEDSPTCTNKLFIEDKLESKSILLPTTSTPKRSDSSTSKSQDGSDSPDYRSVRYTLTQDENVEVSWDWHNSLRRDNNENKKSGDVVTTPKGTSIKRRKRPPSSPLIFNPLRKQLIKKEETTGIEQFKAEMIALAKQIKRSDEKPDLTSKISDKSNEVLPNIKFDDFNNSELDMNIVANDYKTNKNDDDMLFNNKSVDDLFDDSMDEVIIRFSQETEEKLNISPNNGNNPDGVTTENETNDNTGHSSNYLVKSANKNQTNDINKKWSTTNQTIKNTNFHQQLKLGQANLPNQQSNKPNVVNAKTFCKPNVPSNDLFIPDDSFDDFVATCEATDITNGSSSSSMAKLIGVKSCGDSRTSSLNTIKQSSQFEKMPSRSTSMALTSLMRDEASKRTSKVNFSSKINTGQSQINVANTSSSTTSTRSFKFFKSKSHSDSNFNNINRSLSSGNSKQSTTGSRNDSRSGSSSNLKNGSNFIAKNSSRVYGGKIVSNNHNNVQRTSSTTSSLNVNVSNQISTQTDNVNVYNVNRSRIRSGGDGKRNYRDNLRRQSNNITTGIQSMQLQCTPAEIEKKRIEALKKLEARKKRLQGNVCSNSSTARDCNRQRPVER